MLGSVKQALSYGADTFMLYTGAPQNMNRRPINELNIEAAQELMQRSGITDFIVHAPYVINLANTISGDVFRKSVACLRSEIERATAMGSSTLVLHPGAHVGYGVEAGIDRIVEGLNEVIDKDQTCNIALETMAGAGTELGSSFEELSMIFEGVKHSEKLRVCFDTCHVHDSGYDIVSGFDIVIKRFNHLVGNDKIAVFHINDSKNPSGSRSDRHANIGKGFIGYHALRYIVRHPLFENVPMILETPCEHNVVPYKEEIDMLRR